MKCWICGNNGDSGEHLVKASDIRNYFGVISESNPIYTHNGYKRNRPICSVKSKRLKSKGLICKDCNNSRTQRHDMAWESLSNYLIYKYPTNNPIKRINLSKVFPGNSKNQLLNVHLFFAKLFGCRIAEHNINIDISLFSNAILNNVALDELFLMFCETPTFNTKYADLSEIQCVNYNNSPVWAEWLYTVGHLSIKVIYSSNIHRLGRKGKAWHPSSQGKIISIYKL